MRDRPIGDVDGRLTINRLPVNVPPEKTLTGKRHYGALMLLVTGATGRIGRELVRELDARGAAFRVL
ncbi:MAG TPA: hypothetical protein VGJ07_25335, partial [Rugosimonospora sp.]